jgi:peptidoglycan glycosyltransferase
VPLLLVAAAALSFGLYEAGAPSRDQHAIVRRYLTELQDRHYGAMWSALSDPSRRRIPKTEFEAELMDAEQTATASSLLPASSFKIKHGLVRVNVGINTHVFGQLNEVLEIPLVGSGGGTQIVFNSSLLFPGLRSNELLSRKTSFGRRGTLLAADGELLAHGGVLSTEIPEVAGAITGTLGAIPASQANEYAELGYPLRAHVGVDGLQAIFQRRLAGKLGGELLAGTRVLAKAKPGHGETVRTTIEPALEQDAIDALGNNFGGITVLNPRNGAIEAAAGIAFTSLQPPGSTFKIVTATGALESGLAKPTTSYPFESSVELDGFKMQNAGGEVCGGTLIDAFANSCDTTFAPLGAQLGATKLVRAAVKFGFDRPTGLAGALMSTIPPVGQIGGPLSVGASAIGQGMVQASTLEMADVAATIADHGRRPVPTMLRGARPRFVRVTSSKVAGEVQNMMEAVVAYGTGTPAQISGVTVAGKTGTAELKDTSGKKNDAKDTDAWFVAYAPAQDPKVVVCALFPNQGYGADTAAPAVREVIEDALGIN